MRAFVWLDVHIQNVLVQGVGRHKMLSLTLRAIPLALELFVGRWALTAVDPSDNEPLWGPVLVLYRYW